jgi:hypothetical protein
LESGRMLGFSSRLVDCDSRGFHFWWPLPPIWG